MYQSVIPVTDSQGFRGGKLPPRHDSRTLKTADYFGASFGALPTECHNATLVPRWPGFWNHHYGTCVESGMLKAVQVSTALAYNYNQPPDQCALDIYHDLTGFNLQTHQPDVGTDMLSALNYWRQTGIGLHHHKITGYAALNPFNPDWAQIKQAIENFKFVLAGFALPQSAVTQWKAHQPWTNVSGTTPDGTIGHCLLLTGYGWEGGREWVWTVNVDRPLKLAFDFVTKYWDEAYTVVTADLPVGGGFKTNAFAADVARVTAKAA